ncbi:stabilizer of axonemal microtubules 2 [Lampris incognitus]|uniref:stabilizer of axonemal microtubules 2 n=1 Tax=Lampris incognitus TaxID=2546036 RepID=UPI0024B615DD|nr:stabilizer of axonemal microtubules 2 [Lampris incognitus]
MKKLCLCEICSCGRHRCCRKPTALYIKGNTGSCIQTEYLEKFPVYKGVYNPPQSLKPKQEPDPTCDKGKMDGTTTFKTDFMPHEVKRRPGRQPVKYKPNSGKIDLRTTYNLDFHPREPEPVVPIRPREKTYVVKANLDTIPTYKDDFRQWEICKQEITKPEHNYQPPSTKFANSTTFQDDFVRKVFPQRESFKPPNVAKLSDIPFEGLTSNQLTFVPHTLEPRFVRPKETYKPSSQPLQDITTNRQDFQGLPGDLPQSCKPRPNKYSSLAASAMPFEGNTESKDRFKEWPISLPQLHKAGEYVSPTDHMELSTTTTSDYIRHQVQPFISARPYLPPKKSVIPFQNCTTMREDYQPWRADVRQPIKTSDEMHKASGKIENLTTFRAHFTPHELRPNVSFKPANQPMRDDVPMEESTMYRTEFIPKRISACPATFESPPGYMYEDTDNEGHKYFRKMSSNDSHQKERDSAVSMQRAVAVL